MDRIEIKGLRARGRHGVFEHERRHGQTFVVDVTLERDLSAPAASDELGDTVDYGILAQQVAEAVERTRFDLIEALAAHIAGLALADPSVDAVTVRIAKPEAPLSVDVDEVAVVLRREQGRLMVLRGVSWAFLGLGSNIEDRLEYLQSAVDALDANPKLRVDAVSSVYETDPVGGPEQGPYLNMAVRAATLLSPRALLKLAHDVEAGLGRVRDQRWGPRTIDVDILTFDKLTLRRRHLEIPHPRLTQRPFALVPLLEVAPGMKLPDGQSIASALAALAPIEGVTMVGSQVTMPRDPTP